MHRLDQSVEDGKFDAQFDAVDAGFEGPLDVEEIGELDGDDGNVEEDDNKVGVDEVFHDLTAVAVVLVQHGKVFEMPPSHDYVERRKDGLLDEEHRHLEPVPYCVYRGESSTDRGGLLWFCLDSPLCYVRIRDLPQGRPR